MNQTVYALFRTHEDAHYAYQDLLSAGFSKDDISLAIHQTDVATEHVEHSGKTLAAGGALTGLGAGVVSGSLLGAIIGIVTVFVLPTGIVLAGPIAWTLAGAASGGATGTFLGGLLGLGIPKEEADYFAEGVRRGGTLVIVGVDESNLDRAEAILDRDGAVDIRSKAEEFRKDGFQSFEESGRIYTPEEAALERSAVSTPSTPDAKLI